MRQQTSNQRKLTSAFGIDVDYRNSEAFRVLQTQYPRVIVNSLFAIECWVWMSPWLVADVEVKPLLTSDLGPTAWVWGGTLKSLVGQSKGQTWFACGFQSSTAQVIHEIYDFSAQCTISAWNALDMDTEDVGGHGRSPYQIPGPRWFVPLTWKSSLSSVLQRHSIVHLDTQFDIFSLHCADISKEELPQV
jgi:hypothetical protein